jgi:hypothetical protein
MNQEPSRRQPIDRNGRIWNDDGDMENDSYVRYIMNDLGGGLRTFHCLKQGKKVQLVLVDNILKTLYVLCVPY